MCVRLCVTVCARVRVCAIFFITVYTYIIAERCGICTWLSKPQAPFNGMDNFMMASKPPVFNMPRGQLFQEQDCSQVLERAAGL